MLGILKILRLLDGSKNREYVSEADLFLKKLDVQFPELSDSQKHEIKKHKNIFNRKVDLFDM